MYSDVRFDCPDRTTNHSIVDGAQQAERGVSNAKAMGLIPKERNWKCLPKCDVCHFGHKHLPNGSIKNAKTNEQKLPFQVKTTNCCPIAIK